MAGGSSFASTGSNSTEKATFLAWRPVGSLPIFAPSYDRASFLDPAAKPNAPGHFAKDGLRPIVLEAVKRVNYRARYDGFFLMQVEYYSEKLNDFGGNEIESASRKRAMRDIAGDLAMVVKSELGHNHIFHQIFREKETNKLIALFWLVFFPMALILLVVFGAHSFDVIDLRNLSTLKLLLLGMPIFVTLVFSYLVWSANLTAEARLNRNDLLAIRPTRINSNEPLERIPFTDPNWLASIETLRLSDDAYPRVAIGHIRRTYLAVAENAQLRVTIARRHSVGYEKAFAKVFWPGAVICVLLIFGGLLSGFTDTSNLFSLPFALLVSIVFISFSIAAFVFSIVVLNLPIVKALRATQGFMAAANPINTAIAKILTQQRGSCRLSLFGQNIEVVPFDDAIAVLAIKLAGESQRLQVQQFWAGISAALLGMFVAAFAIVQSNPPGVQPRGLATFEAGIGPS